MLFVGGSTAYNKSKMVDGRHFDKVDKSPYLGKGLTGRHEIWHSDTD